MLKIVDSGVGDRLVFEECLCIRTTNVDNGNV